MPFERHGSWIVFGPKRWVTEDGIPAAALGGAGVLEPELVLGALRTVDTTSADEVLSFVARHGVISVPADKVLADNQSPDTPGLVRPQPEPAPLDRAVHIDDIALVLRFVQACSDHWIRHCREDPVEPAWRFLRDEPRSYISHVLAEFEGFDLDSYEREPTTPTCWRHFLDTINNGLSRRPPRLRLFEVDSNGRQVSGYTSELTVGLFTGLCVQLHNVIVEELPIRDCANETCHNVFQRQHGRARKGRYRTEGVMFCSAGCARAQAQRELRRRRKSAKEAR
jgi:hypothetical protein